MADTKFSPVVYNETDGLYYRYEFGDKQIDGSTGEQLAVKNIILQNCYSSLKDSKNGTLDIDYLSGGSGMYITNGKAVPITWKRASANDITHYYTQDGQEITLNPGKTWVEIVENSRASQNKISAEKRKKSIEVRRWVNQRITEQIFWFRDQFLRPLQL